MCRRESGAAGRRGGWLRWSWYSGSWPPAPLPRCPARRSGAARCSADPRARPRNPGPRGEPPATRGDPRRARPAAAAAASGSQGQVHDVNDELSNLERQRESTHRIVNEIERQIGGLASQLDRSSAELILAQDNLAERRAVLQRRLVDIYKRGPLHTFQVLLTAEVVRRPAEPLQVSLPHQPAGPLAGHRRREAAQPGRSSSATTS